MATAGKLPVTPRTRPAVLEFDIATTMDTEHGDSLTVKAGLYGIGQLVPQEEASSEGQGGQQNSQLKGCARTFGHKLPPIGLAETEYGSYELTPIRFSGSVSRQKPINSS